MLYAGYSSISSCSYNGPDAFVWHWWFSNGSMCHSYCIEVLKSSLAIAVIPSQQLTAPCLEVKPAQSHTQGPAHRFAISGSQPDARAFLYQVLQHTCFLRALRPAGGGAIKIRQSGAATQLYGRY